MASNFGAQHVGEGWAVRSAGWLMAGMIAVGMVGCRASDPAGPFRSELTLADEPAELGKPPSGAGFEISQDPARPGLVLLGPPTARGSVLDSTPIIDPEFPFNEALVSWNIHVPPGGGARLELRVGRSCAGGVIWSPFLFVTEWGDKPPGGERVVSFEGLSSPSGDVQITGVSGKIDTDYFRSKDTFDAIQWRVFAVSGREHPPTLERVALTRTDRLHALNEPTIGAATCADGLDQTGVSPVAIKVPFISQKNAPKDLSSRLCSPTSVTMVMGARGVDASLNLVAETVYDRDHNIYGNWPRNVQGAYQLGVPGYLRRYSNWSQVLATFQEGTPIIASIRARPGELRGAPYPKTAGHLIVLRGFDKDGRVLVNDPAGKDPAQGMVTYAREDLERVWLRRTAGTAYVLLEPTQGHTQK